MRSFVLLIILIGSALGGGYFYLDRWLNTQSNHLTPIVFKLEKGTSLKTLSEQLEAEGIVDNGTYFYYGIRLKRIYNRFQAGLYKFEGQLSPMEIASVFMEGKIYEPIVAQITIPEGYNLRLIAERVQHENIGAKNEFLKLAMDPKVAKSFGVPSKTLEGFLYPATYQFSETPTLNDFITRGVESFFANLPPGYEQAARQKGLSLLQAVTFASLIELETAAPEERERVSEVIWRRYNDRVPLGIDAAIIYGIKNYKGDIGWKHLKDNKNPYNTRIFVGLPPTPVGSPSKGALQAVLEPANEGNYYYVVDVTSGPPYKHKFSKTLQEHQHYVQLLVKKTQTRPSKNKHSEQLRKDQSL